MQTLDLSKAFQWLEPGPVVLLTTADRGRANVMTLSWHMVVDFVPQIACVVSAGDYSFAALRRSGECVIAVPGVDLAETVVDIGNCSGQDIDKFARFGLTPLPAAEVGAPLIAECLAQIECRVIDDRLVEPYNLFILEGVHAWIDEARSERRTLHAVGNGTFRVDGETLDLRARMTKWPDML